MSLFRRSLIGASTSKKEIFRAILKADDTESESALVGQGTGSWLFSEETSSGYDILLLKGIYTWVYFDSTISGNQGKIVIKDLQTNKIIYEKNNTTSEFIRIGLSDQTKDSDDSVKATQEQIQTAIKKCTIWELKENFKQEAPYYYEIYAESFNPFSVLTTTTLKYNKVSTSKSGTSSSVTYYNRSLDTVLEQTDGVSLSNF